jgi:hypothetical protein
MTMPSLPRQILLFYPSLPPDTCWRFKNARHLIRRRSAMPSLGLVTAAALLPADATLRPVDLNFEPLEDRDMAWADMAADAQARIEKIHVDFRTDVIYHYETITKRIRGLFAPFASELSRHGIELSTQPT